MISMAKKQEGSNDKKNILDRKDAKLKHNKQRSKEAVTITKVEEKITGSSHGNNDRDTGKGAQINTEAIPESSKIQEATKEFLNPQTFGVLVNTLFLQAAKQWGDHWKLQDYETDQLSVALCNYLNTVLPEIMKEQPELIVLGMTAGIIIVPRVMQSANERKKRKAEGSIPVIHAETGGEGKTQPTVQNISPASA